MFFTILCYSSVAFCTELSTNGSHNSSELPPVDARVTVDAFNYLQIAINSSKPTDPVNGYKIYFTRDSGQKDDSFGEWQHIDVQTTRGQYLLAVDDQRLHLRANTRYKLRVTRKAPDGVESEPSPVLQFSTGAREPLAPTNVEIEMRRSSSQFVVAFDAVIDPDSLTYNRSRYVQDYTVEFSSDNPASPNATWEAYEVREGPHESAHRVEAEFDVVQFRPSTQYAVRVFTHNRTDGAASTVTFFETPGGVQAPSVSILGPSILEFDPSLTKGFVVRCQGRADSPASLSWFIGGFPLMDGDDGYRIRDTVDADGILSELAIPSRTRSETLECMVSNAAGTGRAAVEVRILGPGSPPGDISANSSAEGVYVRWSPPALPNGLMKNYLVYATSVRNLELADWQRVLVDATRLNATLPAHSHVHDHYVRVQGISDRGPGVISETVVARQAPKVEPLSVRMELIDFPRNLSDSNVTDVDPGEEITFRCIAEGRPLPALSYFWTNDQQSEDEISPISMAARVLSPFVVESHAMTTHTSLGGRLVCRAWNSIELRQAHIDIRVLKPGLAPRNIRWRSDVEKEVILDWDPPAIEDTSFLRYRIYISDDVTMAEEGWRVFDTSETTLELSKGEVEPESTYYARIAAVNAYGEGVRSVPIQFVTPMRGPRGPPENVRISLDEANAVVISWRRPKNANGELTKYTLYFTRDPGADEEDYKEWQFVDITTAKDEFSYRMDQDRVGLRPKTLYRVRLTATNNVAESEPTDVFEFETTREEYPVPTDVEVTVRDDNWVIVQFTAVKNPEDRSSYVEDYEVLISPTMDALVAQFMPVAVAEKTINSVSARMTMKISPSELATQTSYWLKVQARIPKRSVQASKPRRFETNDGKRAPTVSIRQGEEMEMEPSTSEQMLFECDSTGMPRPLILWLFNGDLLESEDPEWTVEDITDDPKRNIRKSSFRLISSSTTRSGVVTCLAINNKGNASTSTNVVVDGPGSFVRDVQIASYHNGFNLSWREPIITNGKIEGYTVFYSASPSPDLREWRRAEVPGSQLRAFVGPVDALTEYGFRLQATSDRGPGVLSPTIFASSGPKYIPLEVRLILSELELKPTGVELYPGTPIRFRCIAKGNPRPWLTYRWSSSSDGSDSAEGSTGSSEFVKILQNDDEFTVRSAETTVYTHSSRNLTCVARSGNDAAEAAARFVVKRPGSSPWDIRAFVNSDNDVTISWKKPRFINNPITSYLAYVTKKFTDPLDKWRKLTIDGNRRRYTFVAGELEQNSEYVLRMRAVNDHGEGPLSQPILIRTANGGPLEAPTDVTADVSELNDVTVSWIPPESPTGEIRAYSFYFTRDLDASSIAYRKWQTVEIIGPSLTMNKYILKGEGLALRRDTVYRLRVSASNGIAEGPPSDEIRFQTRSGVFAAPRNVSVTVTGEDVIAVHFDAVPDTANKATNTFASEYVIMLANVPTSTESVWHKFEHFVTNPKERIFTRVDVSDLETPARYAVRVAGKCDRGTGDLSPAVYFDLPAEGTPTDDLYRR